MKFAIIFAIAAFICSSFFSEAYGETFAKFGETTTIITAETDELPADSDKNKTLGEFNCLFMKRKVATILFFKQTIGLSEILPELK